MIDLRRDPKFQRAVQHRMASNSWRGGSPSVADVASKRTREIAGNTLMDERHATNIALKRESLEMAGRQHDARLGFANEQLDEAKEQGGIATGLAVGNLGVSALAGVRKIQNANKRAAAINEIKAKFPDLSGTANFLAAFYGG